MSLLAGPGGRCARCGGRSAKIALLAKCQQRPERPRWALSSGAVRLERQRWLPRLQLLGLTAIAAWNFLWQLGSSSLYVDEVQSVNVATQPLAHFVHALSSIEITPPGYFLLLHEWVLVAHGC